MFLFQRFNLLPEQEPWREVMGLRKRAKYLKSCKDAKFIQEENETSYRYR